MNSTYKTHIAAIILSLGVATAGYFIGNGIIRFKKFDQAIVHGPESH